MVLAGVLTDIALRTLKEYLDLLIKVVPYFLLGAGSGALLGTYVKPEWAYKYLGKGTSSVIWASVLGAVLPGCSCATVPMADGIKKKGAKLGTVTAFIMMSPLLSPQTVFLTFAVLGWKFTLARLIFPFLFIPPLGVALNFIERKGMLTNNSTEVAAVAECDCKDERADHPNSEKESFWKNFRHILRDIGKYFLIGLFVAAFLTILIPEKAIPNYIGGAGLVAFLLAALVGIPLYVCEGEEVPITFSLLKLGLGAGPAFTFLLGSVGTCVPTMIMSQKIIGRKTTVIYTLSWFVFAIAAGALFGLLKI
jgi:hypothetical protein